MAATRAAAALAVLVSVSMLGLVAAPIGAGEDPRAASGARRGPSAAATPSADALAAPEPAGERASPGAVLVPGSPPGGAAGEPVPAPAADEFRAAGARAAAVTDRARPWASFTLMDRRTGRRTGDARSDEVTNTESTVKAWLAADLLATRAAQGRRPGADERARMAAMIRLSDDDAAQVIWRSLGADASIRKMTRVCGLTDTRVYPGWWSLTQISSRDLAAVGACIVPGRGRFLSPAAGAPLVALMRSVDPSNAFGIPQVRPAGGQGRVAVKNGWTEHSGTGLWNVNCLGIWGPGERWVLAVTTRYPITRGLDHGAALCRQVTTALLPVVRG